MTSIEKILLLDYMYYSHLNQGWTSDLNQAIKSWFEWCSKNKKIISFQSFVWCIWHIQL